MSTPRSSSLPAPSAVGTAAPSYAAIWRRAAGLGALATTLLLTKWTFLVADLYESQAVVEVAVQGERHTVDPVARRSLLALAPRSANEAAGPDRARTLSAELDNRHVAFVCRARSAHVAHQRCGQLVTKALTTGLARGVRRPASLPSRPLPFEHGWGIWLVSCLVGVSAMLLWALGHIAWLRRQERRRPRVTEGPTFAAQRSSFAPAVKIFTPQSDASSPATGPAAQPVAGAAAAGAPTTPASSAGTGGATAAAAKSAQAGPSSAASEALDPLRALREQLYLLAADGCLVVGVCSAAEQRAAKTLVAAQLAWSLAESEQVEVLLLEADFDQPSVHHVMEIAMPPLAGFTQQIHSRLRTGATGPWTVVRCAPSLSVLAEGLVRTPGMMYSVQFSSAINELRSAYDIIVVSGPAIGHRVDARAFGDIVDGVVFVTAPGADNPDATKTMTQLFRDKRFVSLLPAPQAEAAMA